VDKAGRLGPPAVAACLFPLAVAIGAAAAVVAVAMSSCGTLGDPGKEPAGWLNLPMAGVAPYVKLDIDGDPTNSTQPFILLAAGEGGREPGLPVVGEEPSVIKVGGLYRMWYESSGVVYVIESLDGEHWRGCSSPSEPTPIVWEGPSPYDRGAWEKGRVEAPSVLYDPSDTQAPYKMWYAAAGRSGIGVAYSGDGVHWRRGGPRGDLAPVLVPCMAWEGGPAGSVGSPSVILDDGLFRMWYDGATCEAETGSACESDPGLEVRRIGHAYSQDGRSWFKSDARGQSAYAWACTEEQRSAGVGPVLTPEPIAPCTQEETEADPRCHDWALRRNWEWRQVWSPYVMRDDSSQRRIYRMYYTGGTLVLRDPGTLATLVETYSTSVGYAGSEDGLRWVKQRIGINPVLDEPFQLDLGGFMQYYCMNLPPQGDNLFCRLGDLLSEVSIRILTNEYAPTVIKDEAEFKMWFRQNDLLNVLLSGGQGIGMAANPPRDIF